MDWQLINVMVIITFTSFLTAVCSLMSWSKTAPYSSWSFCISLMWLATLFMAFIATEKNKYSSLQLPEFLVSTLLILMIYDKKLIKKKVHWLTIQMVMFLTVRISERVELLQQQRVLQDPLDGFDQVRLQGGWMLLSGVSLSQESLEIWVGLCWRSRNMSMHLFRTEDNKTLKRVRTTASERRAAVPAGACD